MPVIINRALPPQADDLEINVNGSNRNFRIWSRRMVLRETVAAMTPRCRDLLLIASAVFAADGRIGRGRSTRPEFGASWSREFDFVIPVADPDFWRSVEGLLVEALEFLTGDRFSFLFSQRIDEPPRQGNLLPWTRPFEIDAVVLFSGGLDSLAGALEALSPGEGRVLLLSHRVATKYSAMQKDLAKEVLKRHSGRAHWVPVAATHVRKTRAVETTQRSRSFLFAALGYAAADLLGARHVHFFENGVVSLNLPINGQVIGTMATRTTHPLSLKRMQDLFDRIGEGQIRLDNPYASKTKTEVVGRLRQIGAEDLIAKTRSCSGVRGRSAAFPHCGCCSQCLDRRFAVLAADLSEHDPAEKYEVDLLTGPRETARDRIMALDWTRFAGRLADIDQAQFSIEYAAEIAAITAAFPDRPRWLVIAEFHAMLQRHGKAVMAVLESALQADAANLVRSGLPPNSLLSMVLTRDTEEVMLDEATVRPLLPAIVAQTAVAARHAGIHPLRLTLRGSGRNTELRVHGLGTSKGSHFRLVGALRPYHAADCAQSTDAGHRYLQAGRLASDLNLKKESIWKDADRCRNKLAELHEVVLGVVPEADLVIEGQRQLGYRLDPDCRFTDPDEGVQ